MTPEEIRKCKKNGYVWVSDDELPYQIRRDSGGTRWKAALLQIDNPCMHATRAAAQAAIDERNRLARLAEYRKSMEPITPEQAKDFGNGDSYYVPEPKSLDGIAKVTWCNMPADRWPDVIGGYWTREAAQAALAKHRSVESHETTVGATQPKEVVTDNTQRPTTVRGWLETIPDPAIGEAAIRQCEEWSNNCNNLSDAIMKLWAWGSTSEGVEFWKQCHSAALGDRPWPAYPPKAKQESDGWTQAETDKAKWNDYLNSKRDDETVIFDIHGDAPKESILKEAESLVHGDRRRDYGTPDENFARIARRWTAILNHPVTTTQVVECMIALKFARQEEKPKRDNWVDIAGYAQCGSELTISTKTK